MQRSKFFNSWLRTAPYGHSQLNAIVKLIACYGSGQQPWFETVWERVMTHLKERLVAGYTQ